MEKIVKLVRSVTMMIMVLEYFPFDSEENSLNGFLRVPLS